MADPIVHFTVRIRSKRERGFSLLEVLIALVILSLSSLALFQSMGQMLKLTDQATRASDNVVESFLELSVLGDVISGVVAPWPEVKSHAFTGTAKGFSGLSSGGPESGVSHFKVFRMSLEKEQSNVVSLLYSEGTNQMELARYYGESVEFRYLTDENIWLSYWPPKEDDLKHKDPFYTPRVLPLSVQLTSAEGAIWIKSIARFQNLPYRIEDAG